LTDTSLTLEGSSYPERMVLPQKDLTNLELL